jgi:hypothetical protein
MRVSLTAGVIVFAASLAGANGEEAVPCQTDLIELLQSAQAERRFAAESRIVQERRSLVRSLVILARSDTRGTPSERDEPLELTSPKCLAIRLLGELRAQEAVRSLVQNLAYRVDPTVAGNVGRRGLGAWYPAAASLAEIGNPAVPEVLSFLGKSADPIERHLCVWILVRIDGRDLARFRVEKAIESSRLSEVKANLQAALEYFDKKHLDRAPGEETEETEDK